MQTIFKEKKNDNDAFIPVATKIEEKKELIPILPPRKEIKKDVIPIAPVREEAKDIIVPKQQQQTSSIASRKKTLKGETLKSSKSTVTSRKQAFEVRKLTDVVPQQKETLVKGGEDKENVLSSTSPHVNLISKFENKESTKVAPANQQKNDSTIEVFPPPLKRTSSPVIVEQDKPTAPIMKETTKLEKKQEKKNDEQRTKSEEEKITSRTSSSPRAVSKISMKSNNKPELSKTLESKPAVEPFIKKLSSPPPNSSSKIRPTQIKSESNTFLLEAKQKLLSAQQHQPKVVSFSPTASKKSLPTAPIKKNGLVVSDDIFS